jgi:hypothetical protein
VTGADKAVFGVPIADPRTGRVRGLPSGAVAGGPEVGDVGVYVDGDGAEQANALALGRGDVGKDLVVDVAAVATQLVGGQAEVLRGPHTAPSSA